MELNWLKLHDALKINPRIENYQNHKNLGQALHEDDKKSLKTWKHEVVWLSQDEETDKKKIGPYDFLYLYDKR